MPEANPSHPDGTGDALAVAPLRVVRLPHGRTLVVRIGVPGDARALEALYEGLTGEDRYHRFFSGSRPPRSFVERWSRIAEHGGLLLVATVGDEVVADAGYSRLRNGNGELGITVSDHWRGWLAPYLLDALLGEAAARGIPAIEAEILVDNRPMQALLRSRGQAIVGHPDRTTARIVVGTAGRVPPWPQPHDRPRLLVEAPGGQWHGEAAAAAAGTEVLACAGPNGRPGLGCPVLRGEPCPLAEGADGLVVAFPQDDAVAARIVEAHRAAHPDLAVFVDRHRTDDELAAFLADLPARPAPADQPEGDTP